MNSNSPKLSLVVFLIFFIGSLFYFSNGEPEELDSEGSLGNYSWDIEDSKADINFDIEILGSVSATNLNAQIFIWDWISLAHEEHPEIKILTITGYIDVVDRYGTSNKVIGCRAVYDITKINPENISIQDIPIAAENYYLHETLKGK